MMVLPLVCTPLALHAASTAAYILKLLDQTVAFDSLHWFEAVKSRYAEEEAKLVAAMSKKGAKKEEQQTAQLTLNKLRAYREEYDLLFYSFTGARIFFKD
jgi:WASH complex subunit 7